jgi:adenylylsulfate kinase-like enzyme
MGIYWFTGQPSHGKTTLAKLLVSYLENKGRNVFHIDGDDLRGLTENQNYSKAGRIDNVNSAQKIAHYLHNKGYEVVVSLVSPYISQREVFKDLLGYDLHEFYVHTQEVRERDAYKSLDYEKPITNYINVDTTAISPEQSLEKIIWSTEKDT